MYKIELTSPFIIGHKEIDGEHAELIEILNEMNEGFLSKNLCSCEQQWVLFCKKLEEHQINEERIMKEFDYIDEAHKNDHREILKHAQNVGNNCKTLADWEGYFFKIRSEFLQQILIHDLFFAKHLAKIGYKVS